MDLTISETQKKYGEIIKKSVRTKEDREELEKLQLILSQEFRTETQKLKEELLDAGIKVNTINDFLKTKDSYPEAIPVLIKHLFGNYRERVLETIIRALTVKEAKGKANKDLIRLYHEIPKERNNLRWSIGNAFVVIITKNDLEEVVKIIQDTSNGTSRHRFIEALGKIKSDRVENILIDLLNDSQYEIVANTILTLGKMKSKKAKDKIILFLDSRNKLIKENAVKALKKIG